MKKLHIFLLVAILFLTGCAAGPDISPLQVYIQEDTGFTVENNGQWVTPGDDAVFRLTLEPGLTVGGTDFEGGFSTAMKNGQLLLTLHAVRYPARVKLTLTEDFCAITYDPNGGQGEVFTQLYDLAWHRRPNTDQGHAFTRPGHTLTGWNTAPDGSGTAVGLGSRVTVDQALTLYAQWAPWTDSAAFTFQGTDWLTVTGYTGDHDTIVIPAEVDGKPVTGITFNAFLGAAARRVVLPETMRQVGEDAFRDCALEEVVLFDSIELISNTSFRNCPNLTTLCINAAEAPYGYDYRKESLYADKIDLLLAAQGQQKMVFYGGCSMWYNLDGAQMAQTFPEYQIINMGLNGTVNSALQLQILDAFLEPGDIFFHTPELSSKPQLLITTGMDEKDDKLWAGLEYNYDLVRLVDFQSIPGLPESLCEYLKRKDTPTDYADIYTDSQGRHYQDSLGCIPFVLNHTAEKLTDKVYLDPAYLRSDAMARLESYYRPWLQRGVKVYLSYACVNLSEVPADQQGNVALMDEGFRAAIEAMEGPVLISRLEDYIYQRNQFYDTNYHLQTAYATENTARWIRDLRAQLEKEGGQ